MNRTRPTFGLTLAVGLLLGAAPTNAQIPEEFTNLQVLPEDIPRGELVGRMRNLTGALGVRCNFCHVGEDPSNLEGYDFAADEKEVKSVARGMMTMMAEINESLIPAAGRTEHETVRCATCHRGVRIPIALRDVVLQTIDEEGVDAAIEKYRELRAQYYGRAAYDFGQGELNSVTETLAGRGEFEDALAIIRLNIEHHPTIAYPNFVEAQILTRMEDREGAIRAMERALQLDPENQFFQGQLERLRDPGGER